MPGVIGMCVVAHAEIQQSTIDNGRQVYAALRSRALGDRAQGDGDLRTAARSAHGTRGDQIRGRSRPIPKRAACNVPPPPSSRTPAVGEEGP